MGLNVSYTPMLCGSWQVARYFHWACGFDVTMTRGISSLDRTTCLQTSPRRMCSSQSALLSCSSASSPVSALCWKTSACSLWYTLNHRQPRALNLIHIARTKLNWTGIRPSIVIISPPVRSVAIRVSVGLCPLCSFVCLSARISKTTCPNLVKYGSQSL